MEINRGGGFGPFFAHFRTLNNNSNFQINLHVKIAFRCLAHLRAWTPKYWIFQIIILDTLLVQFIRKVNKNNSKTSIKINSKFIWFDSTPPLFHPVTLSHLQGYGYNFIDSLKAALFKSSVNKLWFLMTFQAEQEVEISKTMLLRRCSAWKLAELIVCLPSSWKVWPLFCKYVSDWKWKAKHNR